MPPCLFSHLCILLSYFPNKSLMHGKQYLLFFPYGHPTHLLSCCFSVFCFPAPHFSLLIHLLSFPQKYLHFIQLLKSLSNFSLALFSLLFFSGVSLLQPRQTVPAPFRRAKRCRPCRGYGLPFLMGGTRLWPPSFRLYR